MDIVIFVSTERLFIIDNETKYIPFTNTTNF